VQLTGADRGLELTRGALGDHPPPVDDRDAVGQLVGLLEVLGAEQDRRPLGRQRPGDLPHLVARPRVQAGGRLVEEHQPRGDDDARRDVQPAAHAPGPVLDQPSGRVRDAERVEQLVRPRPGGGPAVAQQPAEQHEVLPAGELLVDRRQLAGEADQAADRVRLGHHVVPEHAGRTRVRLDQGGQHPDRRRLPGAVGPEDAVDGTGRHGQVDAGDSGRPPVGLDQPRRLDREWCACRHRAPPGRSG
jgi:hypothetical protein